MNRPRFITYLKMLSINDYIDSFYNHKNGDTLKYPEYILTEIHGEIRIRNNYEGISKALLKYKCRDRSIIASIYMDFCIDEVAIDTLVMNGGNPSCYTDEIDMSNNEIDTCRTIIRRLFHGAKDLPEIVLNDVFMYKNRFLSSPRFKFNLMNSKRPIKYSRIEREKLKYFLEYYPNRFSNYSVENMDIYDDDNYPITTYPPRNSYLTFQRDRCTGIIYVVGDTPITLDEWVRFEIMFGKYYRTREIIIYSLCRSESISPKISIKYPLRNMMHNLGYDLAKKVIEYL